MAKIKTSVSLRKETVEELKRRAAAEGRNVSSQIDYEIKKSSKQPTQGEGPPDKAK